MDFLTASQGGVSQMQTGNQYWIFLNVIKGVKPRRVLLIHGRLSQHDFNLVEGIFNVYANQVAKPINPDIFFKTLANRVKTGAAL